MPQLLPAGARGYAVLDLETTGTGGLCRIVKIALLLLSPEGEIEQEWSTVINPGVPIPNAVAHNLDRGCLHGQIRGPILRHHFWEASEAWPELVLDLGDGIDTMPIPLLSLGKLCAAHGVTLSGDDATGCVETAPPRATPAPWPRCCATVDIRRTGAPLVLGRYRIPPCRSLLSL